MHPSYLLKPEVIQSCHSKAPPPLAAIHNIRTGGCTKTELHQDHFWLLAFCKMCRQHLTTAEGDFLFMAEVCIRGQVLIYRERHCSGSARGKYLLLPHCWDGSIQLSLLFLHERLCSFTMWFISSDILMEFVDFYNLIYKSRRWPQLAVDPSKNY